MSNLTGSPLRLALIEDDTLMAQNLSQALSGQGHTCHHYPSAQSFIRSLPRESFDACIVDLMLPDMRGHELIHLLRERGHTVPALMLTSSTAESDVVRALESGADDFVVKPARIGELNARLRALVRRASQLDTTEDVFTYDRFRFDLKTMQVMDGESVVELTQKEFHLALLFLRNVGKPLSRGHIREHVWGRAADIPSRSLDTHVSRVRSKLDLRPGSGYLLAPVYSYGYRLERLTPGDSPDAVAQEE